MYKRALCWALSGSQHAGDIQKVGGRRLLHAVFSSQIVVFGKEHATSRVRRCCHYAATSRSAVIKSNQIKFIFQ